jgi:hypothetical protein
LTIVSSVIPCKGSLDWKVVIMARVQISD